MSHADDVMKAVSEFRVKMLDMQKKLELFGGVFIANTKSGMFYVITLIDTKLYWQLVKKDQLIDPNKYVEVNEKVFVFTYMDWQHSPNNTSTRIPTP